MAYYILDIKSRQKIPTFFGTIGVNASRFTILRIKVHYFDIGYCSGGPDLENLGPCPVQA
jgi:hypothetical protein